MTTSSLTQVIRTDFKMQLIILHSYSTTGKNEIKFITKIDCRNSCIDFKSCIYRKSMSDNVIVSLDHLEQISNHSKFNVNKPCTFFLHGYTNTQRTPAVRKIIEAYITYDKHNLIVLDWSAAASGSYLTAYNNVQTVKCKIFVDK